MTNIDHIQRILPAYIATHIFRPVKLPAHRTGHLGANLHTTRSDSLNSTANDAVPNTNHGRIHPHLQGRASFATFVNFNPTSSGIVTFYIPGPRSIAMLDSLQKHEKMIGSPRDFDEDSPQQTTGYLRQCGTSSRDENFGSPLA
jgi:hypothetical protein